MPPPPLPPRDLSPLFLPTPSPFVPAPSLLPDLPRTAAERSRLEAEVASWGAALVRARAELETQRAVVAGIEGKWKKKKEELAKLKD